MRPSAWRAKRAHSSLRRANRRVRSVPLAFSLTARKRHPVPCARPSSVAGLGSTGDNAQATPTVTACSVQCTNSPRMLNSLDPGSHSRRTPAPGAVTKATLRLREFVSRAQLDNFVPRLQGSALNARFQQRLSQRVPLRVPLAKLASTL